MPGEEITTSFGNSQPTAVALAPPYADNTTAAGHLPSAAPPQSYPSISAHPLFYASRQPWVAPSITALPARAVAAAPPKPSLPPPRNYMLIGTVQSGMARTALLRSANGKTVVLSEGQTLDGWTLREIQHDRLKFEADGAIFELTFPTALKRGPG